MLIQTYLFIAAFRDIHLSKVPQLRIRDYVHLYMSLQLSSDSQPSNNVAGSMMHNYTDVTRTDENTPQSISVVRLPVSMGDNRPHI